MPIIFLMKRRAPVWRKTFKNQMPGLSSSCGRTEKPGVIPRGRGIHKMQKQHLLTFLSFLDFPGCLKVLRNHGFLSQVQQQCIPACMQLNYWLPTMLFPLFHSQNQPWVFKDPGSQDFIHSPKWEPDSGHNFYFYFIKNFFFNFHWNEARNLITKDPVMKIWKDPCGLQKRQ